MKDALMTVAKLMSISAETAPKGRGENYISTVIIDGEDLKKLGNKMIKYGQDSDLDLFVRDGNNVLNSEAVVLIGLKACKPLGLNCGACGYESCEELDENYPSNADKDFMGPICIIRALDMGIALGSAVKTASIHNVDNRIMYRAGVIALKLELIKADIAMGIPLSVSGKSIFFDR
jgi:uncharacterized ferredoxin-like protein